MGNSLSSLTKTKFNFSALLVVVTLLGCSKKDTEIKSISSKPIADAFFKYQYETNLGEIKPGTTMCINELINAGYLSKEYSSDAVISLGDTNALNMWKTGCGKLLSKQATKKSL